MATQDRRAAMDLPVGDRGPPPTTLRWLRRARNNAPMFGRDVSVAGRLAAGRPGVAPNRGRLLRELCPCLVRHWSSGPSAAPAGVPSLGLLGTSRELIADHGGRADRPSTLCVSALTPLAPPLTPPSVTPTPEGNPRGSSTFRSDGTLFQIWNTKFPTTLGNFFGHYGDFLLTKHNYHQGEAISS